jgi:hypothetical protein
MPGLEPGNVQALSVSARLDPSGAEEVIVFRNRFAGVNADSHLQAFGRFGVVTVEALLNVGGGADRVRHLIERRHNAVVGMFHFTTGVQASPRLTSASCTRTISNAAVSPSHAVISVEPTMSVTSTARNPGAMSGLLSPAARRGSPMRPRKSLKPRRDRPE